MSKSPKPKAPMRILVVDHEPALRSLLCHQLSVDGYSVATATSSKDALDKLAAEGFDLLIADQDLPHISGRSLIEQTRRIHPKMRCLLLAAAFTEGDAEWLLQRHTAYLPKPYTQEQLVTMVESLRMTNGTP